MTHPQELSLIYAKKSEKNHFSVLARRKNRDCVGTQQKSTKKITKTFANIKKSFYLCYRYPENNLFTLKKLIPIEDLKRSPAKVIAFFRPHP